MRTSLIVFAAAVGLADAAINMLSPYGAMSKRQGEAFDPDESSGRGETCVEAFGPGSVECRPESATEVALCINPGEGQTCCNNLWGCPAGSFCLVDDLCCPDGLDPATCAEQNGVTLPTDFGSSSVSTPEETTSAEPTGSATSAPIITTEVPTGSGGNGRPTTTASTSVITAGAHHERAGMAAAVLGLAAAIAL